MKCLQLLFLTMAMDGRCFNWSLIMQEKRNPMLHSDLSFVFLFWTEHTVKLISFLAQWVYLYPSDWMWQASMMAESKFSYRIDYIKFWICYYRCLPHLVGCRSPVLQNKRFAERDLRILRGGYVLPPDWPIKNLISRYNIRVCAYQYHVEKIEHLTVDLLQVRFYYVE